MFDTTANKYKVIGMATNCTINLNTNQEDSTTKDDIGLAAMPTIASKSWSVQVDSLNVVDAATILSVAKNMTKITLMWDKVATTDNQTPTGAAYARGGQAYVSDLTLTFNDRENSAKNITFTGTGALATVSSPSTASVSAGAYTKGQFVRLVVMDNSTPAVIAAAKELSLHLSLTLEDSTTKDTTGDWQVQEPTAINYDISTNALVESGETITSLVDGYGLSDLMTLYEAGQPFGWEIANTSGDNNRTIGTVIAQGNALLTTLTVNAPNRQAASYTAQLTGYGPLE
jgi:predicted secreted protein